jgi:ketosteroid isomerase-like protein
MASEDDVRNASKQFYAALNMMANGDVGPMASVWSHSASVTTMHPIGGRQVGWEEVNASFAGVAHLATEGKVVLKDQLIRVVGNAAYELGIEQGAFKVAGHAINVEHRVTNIYQLEGGAWKIVHHHTDLSPAMLDVLSKL